jgi:hypothetical protein
MMRLEILYRPFSRYETIILTQKEYNECNPESPYSINTVYIIEDSDKIYLDSKEITELPEDYNEFRNFNKLDIKTKMDNFPDYKELKEHLDLLKEREKYKIEIINKKDKK